MQVEILRCVQAGFHWLRQTILRLRYKGMGLRACGGRDSGEILGDRTTG